MSIARMRRSVTMSNATEHTPGPWTIELQDELHHCIQCDEAIDSKGYTWAIKGKRASEEKNPNGGWKHYVQNPAYANNEANARLIASAPALLAALEALLIEKSGEVNVDGLGPGEERYEWTRFADCDPSGNWMGARQAIANAKGDSE
jgi:hypothetical protein